MKSLKWYWLCLLPALVSCNTALTYRYVASDHTPAARERNKSEAFYPEPPSAPRGDVRVRSLGLVDLRPKGKDTRIPALHIRVTLSNAHETGPWIFNTQEQSVLFLNGDQSRPLYANSNSSSLPNLEVKPGELRAVDLFFALPERTKSEDEIPAFDLKWLLHSGEATLGETTSFERVMVRETYPVVYPYEPYPIGYGPIWWEGYSTPGPWSPPIRIRK